MQGGTRPTATARDLKIPRIIHQTFPGRTLPPPLAEIVASLKRNNPGWEHRLYDDDDIEAFIGNGYGADILRLYRRIDRRYGAARADVFRYLLVYKVGGVYLDIKSTFDRPIDDVLGPDDRFVLSRWSQAPGQDHTAFGIHPELGHLAAGEFQQWHIIAAAGHPFLAAVIERVLGNLRRYNPWRDGVGKPGVLRVTGPIPYTLAIAPLLDAHPHRLVADESALSLRYNVLGGVAYQEHLPRHYSFQTASLVRAGPLVRWSYDGVRALKRVYRLLRRTGGIGRR